MTQDLREAFEAFRDECSWLRDCYNTYAKLFEEDEETRDLLGQSAGIFFGDLNRILIDYIYLQVCKITDPAKSRGRENLTVTFLNDALKAEGKLTDEIRKNSEGMMRYRKYLKDARNRLITHLDKETILRNQSIGEHDPKEVADFFESLFKYCDSVGCAVGAGPLDIRSSFGKGDVIDLIEVLRRGNISKLTEYP